MLLLCQTSQAQKIHALIYGQTIDDKIGLGVDNDIKRFNRFLTRLEKALGNSYKLEKKIFQDHDFNGKNLDACDQVKSGKDDIIFVYISSHGERSATLKNEFPMITLDGKSFVLYDKFINLLKQPHRSCIMVIDACNTLPNAQGGRDEVYKKSLMGDPPANWTMIPANAKKIFVEQNFDLIITASQVDVRAITNREGSIFTASFIYNFERFLSRTEPTTVTLPNILQRIDSDTQKLSKYQIYNGTVDLTDRQNSPYIPIWRVCTQEAFPCAQGKYHDFDPTTYNILSLQFARLEKKLMYANKESVWEFSVKLNLEAEYKKTQFDLFQTSSVGFDFFARFTKSDDKDLDVRDIHPDQILINYEAVKLSDELKKKLNGQGDKKFLVHVSLNADSAILKRIKYVRYYLPETMVVTNSNNRFSVETFFNKDHYLIARVFFDDQTFVDSAQQLILTQ